MLCRINLSAAIVFALFTLFAYNKKKVIPDIVIANGQMPDITKDKQGTLHLVYGNGDSIMYTHSSDKGKSFSRPALVAILPKLFSFAMRGPQISVNKKGVIITACNTNGDIYSYYKQNGAWKQGARINDADTAAKEGLMALGADNENAFAVWLDVRNNGGKGQRLFGAVSSDGGRSWSKNQLVYASPDKSVCECCKPSAVMDGNHVYVMFRNWLDGNRDLYVIRSNDSGATFGAANKLGTGSWKLNGCPMDGGGLAVSSDGAVQTVWRRASKIYASTPGTPEKEIGEGRGCTMATINNRNVYAWINDGEIVFVNADGQKQHLAKGVQPVLKAVDNQHVICVWENDKQIHRALVAL
jgi:hypothetical protein